MHLLLAQKGTIADGDEAIDLGQSPGDILFLTAADTEMSSVAAAHRNRRDGPSLRLASLLMLKHPMSVDTYVERTARHAKLIVVRPLGGASYFHYLLEALHAAAVTHRFKIAILPGCDKPDPGLEPYSTLGTEDRQRMWDYFTEGGVDNAGLFLRYCQALIDGGEKPEAARPLLKAGIWWPSVGVIGVESWRRVAGSSDWGSMPVEPPSVGRADISPTGGEINPRRAARHPDDMTRLQGVSVGDDDGAAIGDVGSDRELPASISPLVGEMPDRAEGGRPSVNSVVSRPHAQSERTNPPLVALCFYRALVQSGETKAVEALIEALSAEGMPVLPVFVTSLKDSVSVGTLQAIFREAPPDVVLNATSFAVSVPGADRKPTVLEQSDAPVLQIVFSGSSLAAWQASPQGLMARDLAMNVALPEVDGRILARAVSFKAAAIYDEAVEANIVGHEPLADRVAFTAKLAANWARLRKTAPAERRVAIVLANYPGNEGRIGNGVGLDTPAGTVEVLRAMARAGYGLEDLPADGAALIEKLAASRVSGGRLSVSQYNAFFGSLPVQIQNQVVDRWGEPNADPAFRDGAFHLPLVRMGHVVVGVQPARGHGIDIKDSYHAPDLVPPHSYFAFYAFLRQAFEAQAIVHMGKHGNLEWLPGKALALSENCYPEAILGPLPHLYPFIVNDPGEGSQAKRRTAAVIIDHLTPPLTRAENHGMLRDLEALVDEYYDAAGGDPRRLKLLGKQIIDLVRDTGLDSDAGIAGSDGQDRALEKLDAYLCDLKEMQIRDGLHVFGVSPEGRLLTDLTVALARAPRGQGEGADASLQRAIAADAGLSSVSVAPPSVGRADISPTGGEINLERVALPPYGMTRREDLTQRDDGVAAFPEVGTTREASAPISPLVGEMSDRTEGGKPSASSITKIDGKPFNPLDCDMAAAWTGPKPSILADLSDALWRTQGDTVERIEILASALVSGETPCPAGWSRTQAVLRQIEDVLKPSIVASGPAEIAALLAGLDGRFVAPGPSGAPTRGRPDVLPTGRNFYSVDSRAVPTPAAYELGKKSAELLIRRYLQDHGDWPTAFGLTAWGTSNMRTGGDDIAQAMALIGTKPVWDTLSRRVTGYEILPLAILGRPRVDVTLRISGFFRDAFPDQIALFDRAVRAVGNLDEDDADNRIAERMRAASRRLIAEGAGKAEAERQASYRIFGSAPGAYGAGLESVIAGRYWQDRSEIADAYLSWGSHAYGAGEDGTSARDLFEERLSDVDAIVQNQDNREHDILDSDGYVQFEGGMGAAVGHLKGARPTIYHNDLSRPEKPVIRSLEEEIGRVVRGRATNPKWIAGVMRHGYKGAFEIAATVDYLYAFAAVTGAVSNHHFDAIYQAFVEDDAVRAFMEAVNGDAFNDMADKLIDAIDRGLWVPRSNSARFQLETYSGRMAQPRRHDRSRRETA